MAGRSDEQSLGMYAQLEQNLIGPAPDEVLQPSAATPMMEVVAPTNMAEGFEFEVQVNGGTQKVTVPKGGVKEGQKFAVPFAGGAETVRRTQAPQINVPVGAWRDGLFDCFAYGLCHDHLCVALFCPLIAIGQVISRLKLNHFGVQGSREDAVGAFYKILYGFIIYVTLSSILWVIPASDGYYDDDEQKKGRYVDATFDVLRQLVGVVYAAFTMYLVWNVRRFVRARYAIPDEGFLPGRAEDVVCAICCPQLSTMQMLRHTTDYETYRATLCSPTGMPPHIPDIA